MSTDPAARPLLSPPPHTLYGPPADTAADAPPPAPGLRRGLSARQVQMIAIGGTIGTGLFLGTGRALAQGGPASLLVAYTLVGAVVYVTLLLLGEMATQYPVAGSFTAYTARFVSPAYAFALAWNYWLNDAVSVAADLTAAQLVLRFWTERYPWAISVVFFVVLMAANAFHVGAYGELEYVLSSLKVGAIAAFIVAGILVNLGANRAHAPIGLANWRIPGAPFAGGAGGFARVFVTASFAYGGTESLGITAGETRNPRRNMPRVVKAVFWRILLFYVLSVLLIGLNVPYDYPGLSDRTTTTSPFTIVFSQAGSNTAASFMNTVVLSSALSGGNHALFAGTRVLYGLADAQPRLAPAFLARTGRRGVPTAALLATGSGAALCLASASVGSGVLWGWLQNLVGVSNQIAWLSIGLASWRFRAAWAAQGRALHELKFHARWTHPWGPPFVIASASLFLLLQGWSSVLPRFAPLDFVSFYIELPLMAVLCALWLALHPTPAHPPPPAPAPAPARRRWRWPDLVDVHSVDLHADEHADGPDDAADDAARAARLAGRWRALWRAWYLLA